MKVVLFCGGYGMRLRNYSENTPKPLVPVGLRPILWHLMSYYASYGFKEFILCLGYKGEDIKRYFLNYDERLSNDFVFEGAGAKTELLSRDIDEWKITFVDTGLHTNIGGRLWAARHHLDGDEIFLANYSDGLSDVPLDGYMEYFRSRDKIGMFLGVRLPHHFHVFQSDKDNIVSNIEPIGRTDLRMNGGFFIFNREIFNYMQAGEELVEQPFGRLIQKGKLVAYPYDGFWASMDTYKDRQQLDDLYTQGEAPWAIWDRKA